MQYLQTPLSCCIFHIVKTNHSKITVIDSFSPRKLQQECIKNKTQLTKGITSGLCFALDFMSTKSQITVVKRFVSTLAAGTEFHICTFPEYRKIYPKATAMQLYKMTGSGCLRSCNRRTYNLKENLDMKGRKISVKERTLKNGRRFFQLSLYLPHGELEVKGEVCYLLKQE